MKKFRAKEKGTFTTHSCQFLSEIGGKNICQKWNRGLEDSSSLIELALGERYGVWAAKLTGVLPKVLKGPSRTALLLNQNA